MISSSAVEQARDEAVDALGKASVGERFSHERPSWLEFDAFGQFDCGSDMLGLFGARREVAAQLNLGVEAGDREVEDDLVEISCAPLASGLV